MAFKLSTYLNKGKKIISFFLFGLFLNFQVHSQSLSAQEQKKLKTIDSLSAISPEKTLPLLDNIKKSQNPCFKYYGYLSEADYHYSKADFASAKKLYTALLASIEKEKNTLSENCYPNLKYSIINKLFFIEKNLGNYNQAIAIIEKNKKDIPQGRFDLHYALAKISLGEYQKGINILKNDYNKGWFYQTIAQKKYPKKQADKLIADRLNSIGEAYQKYFSESQKTTHLDSANKYYTKAAQLMLDDNFQPEYTTALLYMRRAKIATLKKEYNKALFLYQKRKKFPVIEKKPRTAQLFDLGMADCFYNLKQPDSAIYYSNKFINSFQKTTTSRENLLIAYNIISKSYNERNKSKKAYEYAKKCLVLTEYINKNKATALEFLHDSDLHKIEQESKKTINKKKDNEKIFILVSILIVILSLYYIYKTKQQNKKKVQAFLETIKEIEQPKLLETSYSISNDNFKSVLEENIAKKITLGLQKLEEKEYFLKADFKLPSVAKKLNTNTTYLSQYFNQYKKITFSDYTQELRIQYIIKKLKENKQFRNYTLQAIAEEIGYKDAMTLVRIFKKITGMTPTLFIKELNENDNN